LGFRITYNFRVIYFKVNGFSLWLSTVEELEEARKSNGRNSRTEILEQAGGTLYDH
jgi:hypothetical protein